MDQGQPLVEEKKSEVAVLLRKMADHVERNAGATFGGCAVIVPPAGGDPIELLILDSAADVGQFYATIATRVQIETGKLGDMQRRQQGWPGR